MVGAQWGDDTGMEERVERQGTSRRGLLRMGAGLAGIGLLPGCAGAAGTGPWRGVNLVATPEAPLGSDACGRSLRNLRALGANAVALIPFLWQPAPGDPAIVPGDAVGPADLRAGIRQARGLGLRVMVKPHVWVPQTWAGAIGFTDPADQAEWLRRYRAILLDLAELAAAEGAEALAIGTELRGVSADPAWGGIIDAVRDRYGGIVTYVAHWDGELARLSFRDRLDVAAISLYPPLGDGTDLEAAIAALAGDLSRQGPLWVGELGLRSAVGAQERPWESAEERDAHPDGGLQARVLDLWLAALTRHGMDDVLVWRWFSDPDAGGPQDTDFTIQGKPAEAVLRRHFQN
ncbi:glycoside hydrolase family 113 [Niveispirillum fermenti]|uniref:glycoside hydrolase family 113 n=1 Tax=Niveispirillum fermenti TaxID=1233113 RepID=UPI003A8642B1